MLNLSDNEIKSQEIKKTRVVSAGRFCINSFYLTQTWLGCKTENHPRILSLRETLILLVGAGRHDTK